LIASLKNAIGASDRDSRPPEAGPSEVVIRQKLAGEATFMTPERHYRRRDGAALVLEIHSRATLDAAGRIVGIGSFPEMGHR
jgi:hypothetical protein